VSRAARVLGRECEDLIYAEETEDSSLGSYEEEKSKANDRGATHGRRLQEAGILVCASH